MTSNRRRQHALRKNRVTIPGAWYSITSCIDGRRPILVPQPAKPLSDPRPAQMIIDALRWMHIANRWQCHAYCVMPDHIHVVIELGDKHSLGEVLRSFGSYTANGLNKLLGTSGRVWQPGFYDHCLRNDESLIRHLQYIVENPMRKGFVGRAEDWPFSAIEPDWN
jgi:REP element-mobilizing transposase RayT